jgi:endonuclease/exonuclease/phosphatase family metal-dependent hydrolase
LRIFTFLLAAVASLSAHEAAARPLRVLTYNIHHSEGRDGAFDLERIAGVINAANPDIVALQELDQGTQRSGPSVFQLDELAALTGMTGYFGKTINYTGGEYGNGVLIGSDFSVVQQLNHALPNPASGEARRVMELRLQYAEGDSTARLDFFATHFDHSSADNRQAQVEFVNSLVSASRTPAVLA